MATETIAITSIVIVDPLRRDLGDIPELANSIERFGPINPPVVDANNVLVAGLRRIVAHQHLGRREIVVRRYGDLTEQERFSIALEENERRKQLSVVERRRAIALGARPARKVASGEGDDA